MPTGLRSPLAKVESNAARADLLHTGARGRIGRLHIAGAADGDVERAVRSECDVPRAVAALAAEALLRDALLISALRGAVLIGELPHRIEIAHVERAIVEGEAVRAIQTAREDESSVHLAVVVGVAQQCDLVGVRFGDETRRRWAQAP